MSTVILTPPLADADIKALKIGDRLCITGDIYSARDTAHKRLVDLLDRGQALPFDLSGQIIYYVGPTPARPAKSSHRTACELPPETPHGPRPRASCSAPFLDGFLPRNNSRLTCATSSISLRARR